VPEDAGIEPRTVANAVVRRYETNGKRGRFGRRLLLSLQDKGLVLPGGGLRSCHGRWRRILPFFRIKTDSLYMKMVLMVLNSIFLTTVQFDCIFHIKCCLTEFTKKQNPGSRL
jgi:hypothetical protein